MTFKTYQMADLSAKAIAGSQKCRGAPDRVRVTYSLNRMVNRPPIVGLCSFNTGHAGDRLRHGSSVPILLSKSLRHLIDGTADRISFGVVDSQENPSFLSDPGGNRFLPSLAWLSHMAAIAGQ